MSHPPYPPAQSGDTPDPSQSSPYGAGQPPVYGSQSEPPVYGQSEPPAYGQMAPPSGSAVPPAQPYGTPYGTPYGGQHGYAPYAAPGPQPMTWRTILGYVFGGIAVLICPPLFGALGIVFAALGVSRKEKTAPIALGVAIGGLVVGLILGFFVNTASMMQLG